MISWINKLTNDNPYPQATEDKAENGYAKSELAYFRADYDGNKWWSTVWPINRDLESTELVKEVDSLFADILNEFPDLKTMTSYCHTHFEDPWDKTVFDYYLELEYGFYWLKMITRKGDYNLYLHCFSKADMTERYPLLGKDISSMNNDLPEMCYSVLPSSGEVIIIKRDETGYYPSDIESKSIEEAAELAAYYNKRLGVTESQEKAMFAGSMFGFDAPTADPSYYKEGTLS